MLAMGYFISLLGYGLAIKKILPRLKLGVSILCAFISMALFSYTFMIILGVFIASAYVLIFGGIVAFIIIILIDLYKLKRAGNCLLGKQDLFTIMVYLACVSIFTILLSDGILKLHDSYSFWARAARELYLFDKGYFNADTNIAHWDYNPLFATIQYAITTVFGWQTKYLYYIIIGMFTAGFCAIIEFIKDFKSKLVFLFLVIFFYPMITSTYSTTFLGADGSLALLFTAGVLCWQSRESEDIISALPTMLVAIILPAVKLYSGLMLSLVLVIMLFISFVKNRKPVLRLAFIVMLVGILYMQFSWSAYYNYNVDKVEYARKVAINEYRGRETDESLIEPAFQLSYFIKGNPRTEQLATQVDEKNISEMLRLSGQSVNQFVSGTLYNSSMYIVTIVFLTMFASVLLARVGNKINGNKEMQYTLIWLWTAAIIYILGMFGTYLVQPGTANEPIRYVGVVVIPMVISLLYYACRYWKGSSEKLSEFSQKILLIIFLILAIDCQPKKVLDAYSAKKSLEYKAATYVENILNNKLNDIWKQCSDTERILIIDNNMENAGLPISGVIYSYQYYALPRRGQALYFEFGNKEAIETMTDDYLEWTLIQNRIDTIIVMIDDEDLQKQLTDILSIPINSETQVVKVTVNNGSLNYGLESTK